MRSFFAALALCLTIGLVGCDTPAEPKKDTPPTPVAPPVKTDDAPKDKEKMEPAPALAPDKAVTPPATPEKTEPPK
jgi:hypothetical protein